MVMAQGIRSTLAALLFVAVLAPHFTAQPQTADEAIGKDRNLRQAAVKARKHVATTPKWGFFGTIFHLILEQINDTKSAYNQISELVGGQFVDDNVVTTTPDPANNGSTEAPKISRAEFLRILDRNLKGLARLRSLEWREANKQTADEAIGKDRNLRQAAVKARKHVATTPKWGFFGTIFHLILEQINDTKSAYNQISELVGGQFVDDNVVTTTPDPANNGSTEAPKISRAEFLRILDRNLKGLARLRSLEWREANKDTWANLREYKDELFGGKRPRNGG